MNIFELLNTNLNELLDMADKVRENNVGNIIHIRSLLEISNICLRNCGYCGLRCDNNNLKRYALSVQEIDSKVSDFSQCLHYSPLATPPKSHCQLDNLNF